MMISDDERHEAGKKNSLDTTSSCQSSDSGLGDTLDVVSQYLSVSLGSTLTQTLSTLSSTGHCVVCCCWVG